MKTQVQLNLARRANGSGGDRYEGQLKGILSIDDKKPWVIYVPQSISRDKGIIRQKLTITVEADPMEYA